MNNMSGKGKTNMEISRNKKLNSLYKLTKSTKLVRKTLL